MSNNETDTEIAILSGLLDFYSNRAIAHASFVVAGIFGIYSILSLMNKTSFWLYTLSYIALLIIDVYSFLNFGYYAELADTIRTKLENRCTGRNLEITVEDRKRLSLLSRQFYQFKSRHIRGNLKSIILLALWIVAVVLPSFIRFVSLI